MVVSIVFWGDIICDTKGLIQCHQPDEYLVASMELYLDFINLFMRFVSLTEADKHFLHNKRLHIVGLQWLENCLEKNQRLQEESYSLKPHGWEEFDIEERCCNGSFICSHSINFPGNVYFRLTRKCIL